VIANVPAYRDFSVTSVSLAESRARWLQGLTKDDILVGLNWSGSRATGYDLNPQDARRNSLPGSARNRNDA
jgi:hypothetical protein